MHPTADSPPQLLRYAASRSALPLRQYLAELASVGTKVPHNALLPLFLVRVACGYPEKLHQSLHSLLGNQYLRQKKVLHHLRSASLPQQAGPAASFLSKGGCCRSVPRLLVYLTGSAICPEAERPLPYRALQAVHEPVKVSVYVALTTLKQHHTVNTYYLKLLLRHPLYPPSHTAAEFASFLGLGH